MSFWGKLRNFTVAAAGIIGLASCQKDVLPNQQRTDAQQDTLSVMAKVIHFDARSANGDPVQEVSVVFQTQDMAYAQQQMPGVPLQFLHGLPNATVNATHNYKIVPITPPDYTDPEPRGDNYANGEDTIHVRAWTSYNKPDGTNAHNAENVIVYIWRKDGQPVANGLVGGVQKDINVIAMQANMQNLFTAQTPGHAAANTYANMLRNGQAVTLGADMTPGTIIPRRLMANALPALVTIQ